MTHTPQSKRMTLDKLAHMTQQEFVRIDTRLDGLATKEDLKSFATKEDMNQFKEEVLGEVRKENLKVLQSNDTVVIKLDQIITDQAAHTLLHTQIDDDLHKHDTEIKKIKEVIHIE